MTQEALLDFEHIRELIKEKTRTLTNEDKDIIAYYWKKFMKTYKLFDYKWYDFFWSNFDQEYDDGRDLNDQCREFITSVILDVINSCVSGIDTILWVYINMALVFNERHYWYYCDELNDFVKFVLSEIDSEIDKEKEFENTVYEYNS